MNHRCLHDVIASASEAIHKAKREWIASSLPPSLLHKCRRQQLLPSPREAAGSRRAKLALRGRGWGAARHTSKQPFLPTTPTPDPENDLCSPRTPPRARARGGRGAQRRNSLTPSLRAQAKQSISQRKERWIASSHSLLAMTSRYTFAISRRDAPEVCSELPALSIRGRRECRAPDAPDSRVCNGVETHTR